MEYVSCQLCNADDISLLFSIENVGLLEKEETFSIVKCNNCSFIYTHPQPDRTEISKYYKQSYYGKDNVRFNKLIEFVLELFRKNRAKEIISLMPQGRILDIGCGRGKMLSFLKNRKWQTVGTEITTEASKYAREHLGLNVIAKDLMEIKFPKDYFDIVTLYCTLEHLPNPKEVLFECHRILKPNAWLIVALPNFDSIQTRIFKDKWFHLDVPRHYYHFSLSTVKKVLDLTGFEIRKLQHFSWEYSPYGVLQSLLNKIGLTQNIFYDILKSKTAHVRRYKSLKPYLQVFIMISLLPFLAIITAIICLAESVIRKGGMIKAYARKLNT